MRLVAFVQGGGPDECQDPRMSHYQGSCHCGDVRFEVDLEPGALMSCNCSLCSRAGWLLSFVSADAFTLVSGEDALTDYQFGRAHLHHPFCKRCGVRPYAFGAGPDGETTFGVNVRCIPELDHGALPIEAYDGASL
ncbi:MAG: GFA family protein [Sandaracinaceae bacterium]